MPIQTGTIPKELSYTHSRTIRELWKLRYSLGPIMSGCVPISAKYQQHKVISLFLLVVVLTYPLAALGL
jgi:hypothetical protein